MPRACAEAAAGTYPDRIIGPIGHSGERWRGGQIAGRLSSGPYLLLNELRAVPLYLELFLDIRKILLGDLVFRITVEHPEKLLLGFFKLPQLNEADAEI